MRLGIPVLDSILPVSCWIKDVNSYTVFAHDTNSVELDSFEIDWDKDGVYDSKNSIGAFSHAFDTSLYGERTVKVRAMDEDSIWTEKELGIIVKLGRSVLGPGADYGLPVQWVGDTLFYVYTSSNAQAIVDTADSNGQCTEYYWDLSRDGWDDTTDVPKWPMTVTAHTLYPMKAQARDNDGVLSEPYLFYMFTDEPPPTTTTTSDASLGVRIIRWSGKDTRDGDNTLYKIVAKVGSASPSDSITIADESNTDYIISDFKPGSQYESDSSYDFKFTYTPDQGNGIYHYRIIAKDARGSISRNAGDQQFSF